MLQTGAKILWDIDINNILSLTSDAPIDVRVEHEKSRWELKSYRRNVLDKSVDVRVHSSGFSSVNPSKRPERLDHNALWDTFPAIEVKGVYFGGYGVTAADTSAGFHEALKPFAGFGPLFQRLKRIHGGPMGGLAEIDGTIDYDGFVFEACAIRAQILTLAKVQKLRFPSGPPRFMSPLLFAPRHHPKHRQRVHLFALET